MNSIPEKQNEEHQLRRLLAQRRLYSAAKRNLGYQLVLSVLALPIWTALVAWNGNLRVFAGLWGLLLLLADLFAFAPRQRILRDKAARVQEEFDCEVLGLPWQEITVGHRPSPEVVAEWGVLKEGESHQSHRLTDWYPSAIGVLPLRFARAFCQQTNCGWDSRLRRRYAGVVLGGLVMVLTASVLLGIHFRVPLDTFFLVIILPFSPLVSVGLRQFEEQRQAADRLDQLRQQLEKQWEKLLAGKSSERSAIDVSRRVQDVLFEQRRRNSLVFDWFYNALRLEHEHVMRASADNLISQVRRANLMTDRNDKER